MVAIAAVACGLRVANVQLDEARVPLLGVLAAFIFAAQMLNFLIAGGTSGHFLGATLAAVRSGRGSPVSCWPLCSPCRRSRSPTAASAR
jgi:cobalt/nickel transport system permease protein